MIVSFAGNAGAGKSTAAAKIADALGWPRYYMGGLRRQRAQELGMTLEEYNKMGETDPKTDLEVDEFQKELGQKEDNFIIEGRTSWHFIPQSFKVFLDVDPKEGAARILHSIQKHNNRNETSQNIETIEQMMELNKERKTSDTLRYEKYFGIDAYDTGNFDYVIDTTHMSPDEVFNVILEAIQHKIKENS